MLLDRRLYRMRRVYYSCSPLSNTSGWAGTVTTRLQFRGAQSRFGPALKLARSAMSSAHWSKWTRSSLSWTRTSVPRPMMHCEPFRHNTTFHLTVSLANRHSELSGFTRDRPRVVNGSPVTHHADEANPCLITITNRGYWTPCSGRVKSAMINASSTVSNRTLAASQPAGSIR